jgi:hypothetical protein
MHLVNKYNTQVHDPWIISINVIVTIWRNRTSFIEQYIRKNSIIRQFFIHAKLYYFQMSINQLKRRFKSQYDDEWKLNIRDNNLCDKICGQAHKSYEDARYS